MSLKIPDKGTKNFNRPLSGDLRADFQDFLAEHGMTVEEKKGLVIGGDVGRAYMDVDGRQKLVGWYQVWIDQEVPFGRCGNRTVSNDEPIAKWRPENAENYKMTDEQREEIRRLSEQAQKEKEERHRKAAEKAKELWENVFKWPLGMELQGERFFFPGRAKYALVLYMCVGVCEMCLVASSLQAKMGIRIWSLQAKTSIRI